MKTDRYIELSSNYTAPVVYKIITLVDYEKVQRFFLKKKIFMNLYLYASIVYNMRTRASVRRGYFCVLSV